MVAVFDRGRSADAVYLVMEYVPGRTLRQELTFGSRLPLARSLEILTAVLKASRRPTPPASCTATSTENVLLSDRGDIKVTDFGLARAIEAGDHRASLLLGTAAYLAPSKPPTAPRPAQRPLQLRHPGLRDVHRPCAVPGRFPDDVLALHQTSGCPTPAISWRSTAVSTNSAKGDGQRPRGPVPDRSRDARRRISPAPASRPVRPAPALHSTAPAIAARPLDDPETMVVQTEMAPPEEPAAAPESQDEPAVAVVGPPTHKPPAATGSNRDAAGVRWSFCCWPG